MKEDIMKRIKLELDKLEYKFEYTGTDYLIDAIYLLYNLKKFYNFNLEKDVYPIVANRYEVYPNNVKANIVYATDKMYFDCNEEYLKNYLNKSKISKPGPKKIIRSILSKLKE